MRNGEFAAGDGAIRAPAMTRHRHTPDLAPGQCRDLLRRTSLGRVVFTMPAIRPVSHVIDDRTIVIRSRLGSAITGRASRDGSVICYEAGDISPRAAHRMERDRHRDGPAGHRPRCRQRLPAVTPAPGHRPGGPGHRDHPRNDHRDAAHRIQPVSPGP